MDFLIGGLAGAGATVFTNPIDVVKTRMQLQGELRTRSEQSTRYRGIFHALYVIARADGALALQKGLVPAVLLGFSMNSVRLGTYHVAEVQDWTKTKEGNVSLAKCAFWSSMSGILSCVASNPASVLKTRIQAASHPSIAVGKQHSYKGFWHGCQTIYKTEGMRGFFAGISANCTRLAVGSAAQLTTFSVAKEALLNHKICNNSALGLAFAASSLSGIIVAFTVCPFDVISVRLYNQGTGRDSLYNGVWDCFRKICRTEGFIGLYKGIGPLYLRIAPQTTLSLVIWDLLNNTLIKRENLKL
ncbi:solute carrier family 25 member 35-like isoform X1 [Galleria mellonella]|uniref:Solute carrier family 25 member 35-like isoform X1 n=1 Tax=Galleria mellonella TaxID=7137 RepID=A0A6J1WF94_GALME|nr:solute carrier family 25 member 35-like isoform X1 [Galleria mellonella]